MLRPLGGELGVLYLWKHNSAISFMRTGVLGLKVFVRSCNQPWPALNPAYLDSMIPMRAIKSESEPHKKLDCASPIQLTLRTKWPCVINCKWEQNKPPFAQQVIQNGSAERGHKVWVKRWSTQTAGLIRLDIVRQSAEKNIVLTKAGAVEPSHEQQRWLGPLEVIHQCCKDPGARVTTKQHSTGIEAYLCCFGKMHLVCI